MIAEGPLAIGLVVGVEPGLPLLARGRDLDNYLYPVAQRLGSARLAAAFGRKAIGSSTLAIEQAQVDSAAFDPMFSTRMTGSYTRPQWKQALHDRLVESGATPVPPGPVALTAVLTTSQDRIWTHLWKPLLDAFGPVLGEDSALPFHPHDDRIVSLSLHHNVAADVGHDVIIHAAWSAAS